jgi:hypothetical protein
MASNNSAFFADNSFEKNPKSNHSETAQTGGDNFTFGRGVCEEDASSTLAIVAYEPTSTLKRTVPKKEIPQSTGRKKLQPRTDARLDFRTTPDEPFEAVADTKKDPLTADNISAINKLATKDVKPLCEEILVELFKPHSVNTPRQARQLLAAGQLHPDKVNGENIERLIYFLKYGRNCDSRDKYYKQKYPTDNCYLPDWADSYDKSQAAKKRENTSVPDHIGVSSFYNSIRNTGFASQYLENEKGAILKNAKGLAKTNNDICESLQAIRKSGIYNRQALSKIADGVISMMENLYQFRDNLDQLNDDRLSWKDDEFRKRTKELQYQNAVKEEKQPIYDVLVAMQTHLKLAQSVKSIQTQAGLIASQVNCYDGPAYPPRDNSMMSVPTYDQMMSNPSYYSRAPMKSAADVDPIAVRKSLTQLLKLCQTFKDDFNIPQMMHGENSGNKLQSDTPSYMDVYTRQILSTFRVDATTIVFPRLADIEEMCDKTKPLDYHKIHTFCRQLSESPDSRQVLNSADKLIRKYTQFYTHYQEPTDLK